MATIIARNLLLLCFSWCFLTCPSYSDTDTDTDTILQDQEIRDWQRLVSANGVFRLKFFSPARSKNRYLGILMFNMGSRRDESAVWVANRNSPILDTSGSLMIDSDGNLKISSSGSTSPTILNSVQASSNASATLLDNGNFILRELNSNGSTGKILWQSFDYPTDTLLPGMKLGINFKTGHTWSLTSWRSDDSPASGSFTLGLDPNSTSQLVILWRGDMYWTSGPWHNGRFEYVSRFSYDSNPEFQYFSDENEKYFIYSVDKSITDSRYKISPRGLIVQAEDTMAPFGACSIALDRWNESKAGCTEEKLPDCRNPHTVFVLEAGYMSTNGFEFPESNNLSSFDCKAKCMNNCSCVACASTNDDGTGCEIWSQGSIFTGNAWGPRYIAHLVPENDTDTILQGQEIRDSQRLVSANGVFKLEFFSRGTSKNRYLGILMYNMPGTSLASVVWVANRNSPILDTSGSLMIDSDGNLKISSSGSTDPIILNSVQVSSNASATLLNNGNFILRKLNSNGSTGKILWQSFDYPTDTLLPGMKLGINFKSGHTWSLTSWRSHDSPASGSFTLGLDPNSTSLVILWRGDVYWTSGPWHYGSFEYVSRFSYYSNPHFEYFSDENEKYFIYSVDKSITYSMYNISDRGILMEGRTMVPFAACSKYSDLGDENKAGCTEEKLPDCRNPHTVLFSESGYMSPDGFQFPESDNLSNFDCRAKCMNNCSCVAYASTNDDGTGCKIWSQGSVFTDDPSGERIVHLDLEKAMKNAARKWWIWLATTAGGALIILLSCSLCYLGWKKHKLQEENKRQQELLFELGAATKPFVKYSNVKKLENDRKKRNELQLFSFRSIATATNNFSIENKLGEGGFGPVYKGKLLDEQEIAIKRLSRSSGQGLTEFKNEIVLIAKLQHNNLVRLLGCCIEGEEKILIYEYLPNKSLDFFLFDPNKKCRLDWKKRYNIIEGVAQGLLYLHKYSRLRVVHRDLKASNILLDDDLNPKISDFGMARIFGGNEFEANTNKIVGTYGYMAPEYAMEGIFSTKSDVFSFGVLLLEIVSSKKNYSSHHHERPLNLIGYAWELWKEGRALELMDQTLGDLCPNDAVLRCIHVGLLCVQENPMDRPTMSDVVSMFTNEILQLSAPRQPAFFIGRSPLESEISRNKLENCSLNNASISVMEAR